MRKKHKVAKTSFDIALLMFIIVALMGAAFLLPNNKVSAGSTKSNVYGWAWSSNVGWLSFNGAHGAGGSYGVYVDTLGNLSGYAWSANIGWVSFNATDVAECPGTPGNFPCAPHMDLTTGEISGWARACAGTNDGECKSNPRNNGWDGWISFRGASPAYGVKTTGTNPRDWSGFAWGGEVVGWMSFRGEGYGVSDRPAPPPFVAICSGDPDPSATNHDVKWSSLVSGGTAPYAYSWSGDNGLAGSSLSVTKKYITIGIKKARVRVTDSSTPEQIVSADCTVAVVKEKEVIPGKAKFKEIIPE